MKSKFFLYISLAVDVIIAISKFVAAAFTGSSSMVSEGVHSVIDAFSQVLLIWGVKTSKQEADVKRPFGYGRELYFWSFIVSLIIFLLGGCISVYEGVMKFKKPLYSDGVTWSYAILGLAFLFNSISMVSALRAFNKQRGHLRFWQAVRESRDPSTFIVLLGDVGDLISLTVAFFGLYLEHRYHNPYFDALSSIVIGGILLVISMVLVRESKSLLMGEPLRKRTLARITRIAEGDDMLLKILAQLSIYLSPEEIVLQMTAVFKNDLTTEQITQAIERVIQAIQKQYPRITQIFIEPVAAE